MCWSCWRLSFIFINSIFSFKLQHISKYGNTPVSITLFYSATAIKLQAKSDQDHKETSSDAFKISLYSEQCLHLCIYFSLVCPWLKTASCVIWIFLYWTFPLTLFPVTTPCNQDPPKLPFVTDSLKRHTYLWEPEILEVEVLSGGGVSWVQ